MTAETRERTHWHGCWTEHEECSPPERIWLQSTGAEITWCVHPVGECGEEIEYVRADRVERLEEAVRELERGAMHATDMLMSEPTDPSATRIMGDRTIVHRKAFDRLFAALTETRAEGEG